VRWTLPRADAPRALAERAHAWREKPRLDRAGSRGVRLSLSSAVNAWPRSRPPSIPPLGGPSGQRHRRYQPGCRARRASALARLVRDRRGPPRSRSRGLPDNAVARKNPDSARDDGTPSRNRVAQRFATSGSALRQHSRDDASVELSVANCHSAATAKL